MSLDTAAKISRGLALLLYFLLGCSLFSFITATSLTREEEYPQDGIDHLLPYQLVVWKIRRPLRVGERLRVSAQHRFAGEEGAFRFVVARYDGFLRFDFVESEEFRSARPGEWSTWEFEVQHPTVFLGFRWDGAKAPVPLRFEAWRNRHTFENAALLRSYDAQTRRRSIIQTGPLRANLRVEAPVHPPSARRIQALSGAVAASAVALALLLRLVPNPVNLLVWVAGILFSYRTWAVFYPADWNWGGHFLAYLPESISMTLLLLFPACIALSLSIGRRILTWRIAPSKSSAAAIVVLLTSCAWLYRSNRVYGDREFGLLNVQHTPLVKSLWETSARLAGGLPWDAQRLVSIAALALYLILLPKLLAKLEGRDSKHHALGILFFLSISTTQTFFGYVEVYSITILSTLTFIYVGLRALDDEIGPYWPIIVAFIAYLLHLSEAMLLFPLLYLLLTVGTRRRLDCAQWLKQLALVACSVAGIMAVTFGALFLVAQEQGPSRVAELVERIPYYGLEFLWGGPSRPSYLLSLTGYVRGAHGSPILSIDNLWKISNYAFHYSVFIFVAPPIVLIWARRGGRWNSHAIFLALGCAAYLILLTMVRPAFLPMMRDWDLFAMLGAFATCLTYRTLVRAGLMRMLAMFTLLNLLQTVPWIYANHVPVPFPW